MKKGVEKLITKKIDELIPYERNARTHSDIQIQQIAKSIKKFGFTNPILLDGENGIIAGHGRLLAAKELGLKEVPCLDLKGLTKEEQRAYVIADNQLALNAGWDNAMLIGELEEITLSGIDVEVLGFTEGDLINLKKTIMDLDEDRREENHVVGDSRFLLLVEFDNEEEQQTAFDELTEKNWNVKIV